VLAAPVVSCRRIAVVSVRGGAGKTTLAALIGAAISERRQDGVLAVDADAELGSLPMRMGVQPIRSLRELAAAGATSWEAAAPYLSQASERLWVLPGTAAGQLDAGLDLPTYQAATGPLEEHFAVEVVDCSCGLLGELQRGIAASAHAQILVAPSTPDGARSVQGALAWYARNGHLELLSRTVIALVSHTQRSASDVAKVAEVLSPGGPAVLPLPYDKHLADGGAIQPGKVRAETRAAAARIAAQAFSLAVRAGET
jgi:MinD-like ATPase involved in chromosome partitioning or flagellar assembly